MEKAGRAVEPQHHSHPSGKEGGRGEGRMEGQGKEEGRETRRIGGRREGKVSDAV